MKQFFFRKDFFQNWDLKVSRLFLCWGRGYTFNPTDVLAAQKELSDQGNVEKRVPGNDLIKLEYFGIDYSAAIVYLANLKINKKLPVNDHRLAFRFIRIFGDWIFPLFPCLIETKQ